MIYLLLNFRHTWVPSGKYVISAASHGCFSMLTYSVNVSKIGSIISCIIFKSAII